MQHFADMLGVQHLDLPHLRAKTEGKEIGARMGKGKEIVDCTGQGTGGTGKGRTNKGGDKKKKETKSKKEVDTSEQVRASGSNDKVKKYRADKKKKAKT